MSNTLTDTLILFDLDKISTGIEELKGLIGKPSEDEACRDACELQARQIRILQEDKARLEKQLAKANAARLHAVATADYKAGQLEELHKSNEWQADRIGALEKELAALERLNMFLDGQITSAVALRRLKDDHSNCFRHLEEVLVATLDDGLQLVLPGDVDKAHVAEHLRRHGSHSVTFSTARVAHKQNYQRIRKFL
jgi:DNA repair exonuclease SbcCD ATPase subunit